MTEWEMKYYHMNKLASDLNIGYARLQGERDGLRKAAQMALDAMQGPIYGEPVFGKPIQEAMEALRKELSE